MLLDQGFGSGISTWEHEGFRVSGLRAFYRAYDKAYEVSELQGI